MQASESPIPLSEKMMDRFMQNALVMESSRRAGTLSRLREACDAILSGEAEKLARNPVAKEDPAYFRQRRPKLSTPMIERYVKMRQRLEGAGSDWTGPVAVTIRKDPDLDDYYNQRLAELAPFRERRFSAHPRADHIEAAMRELPLTDRSIIREALDEGRQAKRELDMLRHALRNIPGLDLDAVLSGDKPQPTYQLLEALPAAERLTLKSLLSRITDPNALRETGLVFRDGRLSVDYSGEDIVMPEEISLLRRLAGES